MDRRKFVLGSIFGSSALIGLTSKVILSPELSSLRAPKRFIGQAEFEKMLSLSAAQKKTLFLPSGATVKLNRPTKIDSSIYAQGARFIMDPNAQLIIQKNLVKNIHLKKMRISSKSTRTKPLISLSQAQGVVLENLHLSSQKATPLMISHSQNIQIIQSEFQFLGFSGIEIDNSDNIQVQNNVFMASQNLSGEQEFALFDNVRQTHIENNTFKSKTGLAGLSFLDRPADQKSLVKNNTFSAS